MVVLPDGRAVVSMVPNVYLSHLGGLHNDWYNRVMSRPVQPMPTPAAPAQVVTQQPAPVQQELVLTPEEEQNILNEAFKASVGPVPMGQAEPVISTPAAATVNPTGIDDSELDLDIDIGYPLGFNSTVQNLLGAGLGAGGLAALIKKYQLNKMLPEWMNPKALPYFLGANIPSTTQDGISPERMAELQEAAKTSPAAQAAGEYSKTPLESRVGKMLRVNDRLAPPIPTEPYDMRAWTPGQVQWLNQQLEPKPVSQMTMDEAARWFKNASPAEIDALWDAWDRGSATPFAQRSAQNPYAEMHRAEENARMQRELGDRAFMNQAQPKVKPVELERPGQHKAVDLTQYVKQPTSKLSSRLGSAANSLFLPSMLLAAAAAAKETEQAKQDTLSQIISALAAMQGVGLQAPVDSPYLDVLTGNIMNQEY